MSTKARALRDLQQGVLQRVPQWLQLHLHQLEAWKPGIVSSRSHTKRFRATLQPPVQLYLPITPDPEQRKSTFPIYLSDPLGRLHESSWLQKCSERTMQETKTTKPSF